MRVRARPIRLDASARSGTVNVECANTLRSPRSIRRQGDSTTCSRAPRSEDLFSENASQGPSRRVSTTRFVRTKGGCVENL